jgi:hypothetical protein
MKLEMNWKKKDHYDRNWIIIRIAKNRNFKIVYFAYFHSIISYVIIL